ncbi:MAG: hypothetical protein ACREHC_02205 [Candidatus Levyibacteriota bacterium]
MAEGEAPEIPKLKAKDKLVARDTAQRALLDIPRDDRPNVKSIREKLLVQRWQEVLPQLEGDGRTLAPQLKYLVEGKIGIPSGDGTQRRRDGEHRASYTRANDALKILLPLLESADYDTMKESERTALRDKLREALDTSTQFPQFQTLSDDQKTQRTEDLLRNLKLKAQVIEELKPILAMPLTSDEELIEAEKATKVNERKEDEASTKKAYTSQDLRDAQERLRDLIRNPAAADQGPHARLLLDQIDRYGTQMDKLETQQGVLRSQLTDGSTLPTMPQEYMTTQGQIRQREVPNPAYLMIRDQLNANQNQQNKLQETILGLNIERINKVPTEEHLEERRNVRRQDAASAMREEVEAEFDAKAARVRYKELLERRKLEEQAMSIAMDRALPRAFEVFAAKEIEHGTQLAIEKMLEDKQDDITKLKEDYMHHVESRWRKAETRRKGLLRRKVEDQVLDKQKLKQDMTKFFAPPPNGGPDHMMHEILSSMPEWANLNDDEQKVLLGDVELKNAFLTPLLANHILVNRLQPGELRQILGMQHVKHLIEDAMKTNEDYRATVTRLAPVTGTDDLNFESAEFKDRFARAALEHPGLLFFPLTTIPWALVSLMRALWESNTQNPRDFLANQIAA